MTLADRLYLLWRHQKPLLLTGLVYNILSVALLVGVDSVYSTFFFLLIIKIPLVLLVVFLMREFSARDHDVFYVNLGLGRRRMFTVGLLTDILSFLLLCIIVMIIK